jgi:hypothetical protein
MSRYHASLYSQQNRAQARPQPQAPSNFQGAAPRVQSGQDLAIAGGINVQNYQKVAAFAEANKKERDRHDGGGTDGTDDDGRQDQAIQSNVNNGDWNESSQDVVNYDDDDEMYDDIEDDIEDEEDKSRTQLLGGSVYPEQLYPKRRVKSGSMTSHYETKLEKMYKATIEAIRVNEIKMNALQYEDAILHRRLKWIQNMVHQPLDT